MQNVHEHEVALWGKQQLNQRTFSSLLISLHRLHTMQLADLVHLQDGWLTSGLGTGGVTIQGAKDRQAQKRVPLQFAAASQGLLQTAALTCSGVSLRR